MDSNEKVIANFETRVRQLILRFQDLKKENQVRSSGFTEFCLWSHR